MDSTSIYCHIYCHITGLNLGIEVESYTGRRPDPGVSCLYLSLVCTVILFEIPPVLRVLKKMDLKIAVITV